MVFLLAQFVTARAAAQTFWGVAGMVRSLLPMASVMALISAGGEPMAPASPQPLMPSGLFGRASFWCRDVEGGQVVGARHGVVHVASRQQLAVSGS
jgi:hypothetical protein